jgi:hypothetical protein
VKKTIPPTMIRLQVKAIVRMADAFPVVEEANRVQTVLKR